MIVIAASFGGAIWGFLLARKRGGNRLDMAQHAAGCAIVFGLLGIIVSIILARFLG